MHSRVGVVAAFKQFAWSRLDHANNDQPLRPDLDDAADTFARQAEFVLQGSVDQADGPRQLVVYRRKRPTLEECALFNLVPSRFNAGDLNGILRVMLILRGQPVER